MAKSLIRKNQLHPDVADLVSGYGDQFFITPAELANSIEIAQAEATAGAVLVSGNQTISGLKNFLIRPNVNGVGVLLQGEAAGDGSIENVVYTTGEQNISGLKTFKNGVSINSLVPIYGQAQPIYGGALSVEGGANFYNQRPTVNGKAVLLKGEAGGNYLIDEESVGSNLKPIYNSPFNNSWSAIAISNDGKYQTAISYGDSRLYRSQDYGKSWKASFFATYQVDIAMSSDGKYQTVVSNYQGEGNVLVSNDYGETWSTVFPSNSLNSLRKAAIAQNGQIQVVCSNSNQPNYISRDYGVTWNTLSTNAYSQSVAVSSDGKYIIFGNNNGSSSSILVSNSYGVGFTTVLSSISNPKDFAISEDGKYQVAVTDSGEFIVLSTDYGSSWNAQSDISSISWQSVSMSSNGKYIVASAPNNIFVSTDYGNNFRTINIPGITFNSIKISENGTHVICVGDNDNIYLSKTSELIEHNLTVNSEANFNVRPTLSGAPLITTGDLVGLELDIEGALASSSAFDGDRPIKAVPVNNTNYGGTTISGFLENMFFPYLNASVTLNAPTIYTYGINSISSINFIGSITQRDDIVTGIAYRNFTANLSQETLTVGNTSFSYVKNGVSLNQTITQTSQQLNTLLYVTKNGNPETRSSNLQVIRFEPIYYYGCASTGLIMGGTYDNSIFSVFNASNPASYTYSIGSRPGNVTHTGFKPNNQYIYFIYPSPASTQDNIINWGNSLSSIYDVNANFEYINTYSNLGFIFIEFPNHTLRYRVYRSNDLITLEPEDSLDLRFTFGN